MWQFEVEFCIFCVIMFMTIIMVMRKKFLTCFYMFLWKYGIDCYFFRYCEGDGGNMA